MRIKPFVMLLAVFTPAYFILTPRTIHIPSDLRDAVGEGALNDLPGSADMDSSAPQASAPKFERTYSKSIYGSDDRQDYFETTAPMRKLADSVVSLWPAKQVKVDKGVAMLATVNFADAVGLCPGEKFADQPIGAFCSGTLVGDDIVMTAGHCITDDAKCADTKLVFGYNVDNQDSPANTILPAKDVYTCKSIIKRALDTTPGLAANGGPGADFALIKLDRAVTDRAPLAIHRNAKPAKGDQLFVIGHPVGLPVKIAGNAKVRDASPRYFFKTDLDTFGGNSGSAVFNARTNLIEGILVRGDVDFVKSPAGCKVASVVAQDAGNGESVTKISALESYIP